MKLAERIKGLREKLGINQRELKRLSGVASISVLEAGRSGDLRLKSALRLADVFGISVEEMVDDVEGYEPVDSFPAQDTEESDDGTRTVSE